MTRNSQRYNRDTQFVRRLQERVKVGDTKLLTEFRVRDRLAEIKAHWTKRGDSPSLVENVSQLIAVDVKNLPARNLKLPVLVTITMRDGATIKVRCRILKSLSLPNRFQVTPVDGSGTTIVREDSVEFIKA
jgi:hypothetical protein